MLIDMKNTNRFMLLPLKIGGYLPRWIAQKESYHSFEMFYILVIGQTSLIYSCSQYVDVGALNCNICLYKRFALAIVLFCSAKIFGTDIPKSVINNFVVYWLPFVPNKSVLIEYKLILLATNQQTCVFLLNVLTNTFLDFIR